MTKVFVGTRDVVVVSGEDAESYLQGQISQDLSAIGVGESAWSLILQPQGKVDAWFRITRTGDDRFVLDLDAGFGDALLARLKRFLLRVKVDVEAQTWNLHAYDGPVDVEQIAAPVKAASASGDGVDVLGPELAPPGHEQMTSDEHAQRRIEAGIPAMGSELTEATIPAEAGIVQQSVSFTKGCYTGQELVARVDSRGDNTPRRLRIVAGEGTAAVGDELSFEGNGAGVLTSVVSTDTGWVALGYVKRSALEHATLELDGRAVSVRPVPSDAA